jgi:hypothetical protein
MESVLSVTQLLLDPNLTEYELNVGRLGEWYLVSRTVSEFDYEQYLLRQRQLDTRTEQDIYEQTFS